MFLVLFVFSPSYSIFSEKYSKLISPSQSVLAVIVIGEKPPCLYLNLKTFESYFLHFLLLRESLAVIWEPLNDSPLY